MNKETSKNMPIVTVDDAYKLVETLCLAKWQGHNVPSVCLVGDSGIGKTRIPCDVAEAHGKRIIVFRAAEQEGEDLKGIPYPKEDDPRVFQYRIIEELKFVFDKESEGILFFDDWNRGERSVVNVLFSMVENRTICTVPIPERWYVMGAINPAGVSGYMSRDFFADPAFRRRFAWIGVTTTKDSVLNYAQTHDWHECVTSYIEVTPDDIVLGVQEFERGEVGPRPSNWESVSNFIKTMEEVGCAMSDVISMGVCGIIGDVSGRRFMEFYSSFFSKNPANSSITFGEFLQSLKTIAPIYFKTAINDYRIPYNAVCRMKVSLVDNTSSTKSTWIDMLNAVFDTRLGVEPFNDKSRFDCVVNSIHVEDQDNILDHTEVMDEVAQTVCCIFKETLKSGPITAPSLINPKSVFRGMVDLSLDLLMIGINDPLSTPSEAVRRSMIERLLYEVDVIKNDLNMQLLHKTLFTELINEFHAALGE